MLIKTNIKKHVKRWWHECGSELENLIEDGISHNTTQQNDN